MNQSNNTNVTNKPIPGQQTAHTPYKKYLPEPTPAIKELLQNASGNMPYGLTNDCKR